jgi:hypothetical protein
MLSSGTCCSAEAAAPARGGPPASPQVFSDIRLWTVHLRFLTQRSLTQVDCSAMEASTEKRLRLRLRVVDAQQRGKVDVTAACTLQQLKAAVQQELRVRGDDFDVSLDKKVSLICG